MTIGRTIADSVPHWPDPVRPPGPRTNVLIVLLDDVGFGDFGCFGSEIATPVIDRFAAAGVRYTGFHTTAMCSTTRSALLTGRNHHDVGMGCLANFDSGFPGYRGKIATEIPTLADRLRDVGYRNYMVGKWHCTPLTETGPTGPFDGWLMISRSGLDIGLDRGTTVADYDGTGRHMGPFAYTGDLVRVTVDLVTDQEVDHEGAGAADLARE